MKSHRIRQRVALTLVLTPIVLIVVACSVIHLAARTPLLRHRLWEFEIGRLGLWMGDPIDAFDAPLQLLRAENGYPYIYVRTAVPLDEAGHYWFTGIKWDKREEPGGNR